MFSIGRLRGFLITNINTLPPQYFVVKVVLRIDWKLLANSSNLLLLVKDTK